MVQNLVSLFQKKAELLVTASDRGWIIPDLRIHRSLEGLRLIPNRRKCRFRDASSDLLSSWYQGFVFGHHGIAFMKQLLTQLGIVVRMAALGRDQTNGGIAMKVRTWG